MILACASCGATSADVPLTLLSRVASAGCAQCGSKDIGFADEVVAGKKGNPYVDCPKCGAAKVYRTDHKTCTKCGYKGMKTAGGIPEDSWRDDYDKVMVALKPFVITLDDGSEAVGPDAPEDLTSLYSHLMQIGYANGFMASRTAAKTASPVVVDPTEEIYKRLVRDGWKPGHTFPLLSGQEGVLMIPPGESDDQYDLMAAVPDLAYAASAEGDDSSFGTGPMALIRSLIEHVIHGHDPETIPHWVPKSLLLPEEIESGKWVSGHGLEGAFASKYAAPHSFLDEQSPASHWGPDEPTHSGAPEGGEHRGPIGECPLCVSSLKREAYQDDDYCNQDLTVFRCSYGHRPSEGYKHGSLQTQAAGVRVPVVFRPNGDIWRYINEELGAVGIDHMEDQGDGTWKGEVIVPEIMVEDVKALSVGGAELSTAASRIDTLRDIAEHGPLHTPKIEGYVIDSNTAHLLVQIYDSLSPENQARFDKVDLVKMVDLAWKHAQFPALGVLKKAAWGIFSNDNHKLIYGPSTKEAVEMALASGRYATGYYVGTMPDKPGTEWAPPPEYNREDPFAASPYEARHAKVAEIVKGITTSNPSIARDVAERIAKKAVNRYPSLWVSSETGDR